MQGIDSDYILFRSLIEGLDKNLFPKTIKSEASEVEVSDKILNSPDIDKYLKPEFVERLKAKLNYKAQGLIKQAEINSKGFDKFATFEKEQEE